MKKKILPLLCFFLICFPLFASGNNLLPPNRKGAPSSGNVSCPLIRLVFEDEVAFPCSEDELFSLFNREKDPDSDESLQAFFLRSSGNLLNWELDRIVTVTLPMSRSSFGTDQNGTDADALISAAVALADEMLDFSRYDSNGDGKVDAVYFEYAGDSTAWDELFWPHAAFFPEDLTADGVRFGPCCFFGDADLSVLCHETGHLLGLPDAYNYASSGNLQDLNTPDLMNDSSCDINAFFKWMLGWIEAEIITPEDLAGGPLTLPLSPLTDVSPSGSRALILTPDGDLPYGEYLLVEYIRPEGNMKDLYIEDPAGGFRIFRINARLEDGDFAYDCVYGSLIRLITALQTHDPERDLDGSLFLEGDLVGPDTDPASCLSGGTTLGFTGFVLSGFHTGDQPAVTLSLEERPAPDPSLTLTCETDLISNRLNLVIRADRDILPAEDFPVLRLEHESTMVPVLLESTEEDYRSFLITLDEPDTNLPAGSCWELVFPSGTFVLDRDIYSDELRLPLQIARNLLSVTAVMVSDCPEEEDPEDEDEALRDLPLPEGCDNVTSLHRREDGSFLIYDAVTGETDETVCRLWACDASGELFAVIDLPAVLAEYGDGTLFENERGELMLWYPLSCRVVRLPDGDFADLPGETFLRRQRLFIMDDEDCFEFLINKENDS